MFYCVSITRRRVIACVLYALVRQKLPTNSALKYALSLSPRVFAIVQIREPNVLVRSRAVRQDLVGLGMGEASVLSPLPANLFRNISVPRFRTIQYPSTYHSNRPGSLLLKKKVCLPVLHVIYYNTCLPDLTSSNLNLT